MGVQSQPLVVTPTPTGFAVRLTGPVHADVARIRGAFHYIVAAEPADVTLDLSGTTFLSSAGVGLLVWLYKHVGRAGGAVRVVSVRTDVLRVLTYARLAPMLQADTATLVPG